MSNQACVCGSRRVLVLVRHFDTLIVTFLIFFRVAAAVEVDTVDEAVVMANASQYSLMASLWTENVHQAFDVAARIRAGEAAGEKFYWPH